MSHRKHWNRLVLACGFTLLIACGTTAPTRFYTLESAGNMSVARSESADAVDVAVAVGPFRFAAYLDRPHIVSRLGASELDFAEFDRWAAPLPAVFQRTVAANLADALESQRILEFPTNMSFIDGYQVTGRVTRFDTDSQGRAVLTVQWGIRSSDGEILKPDMRTQYEYESSGDSYAAKVKAQSATVAAFSREIANAILDLQK